MTLSLDTIKPAKGAAKKRKRIGRGNAAGQGTYCGRGIKGQNARAGVSGLKRLGMKQVLLRIPKNRGFKSLKPKNQVINLADINKYFKDGDIINPKILHHKGLIANLKISVKLLGQGELKLEKLQFSNIKISASAKAQVEKMNGQSGAGTVAPKQIKSEDPKVKKTNKNNKKSEKS